MTGWMIVVAVIIPIIQIACVVLIDDDGKAPFIFWGMSAFGLIPMIFAKSAFFYSFGCSLIWNFLIFIICLMIILALSEDFLIDDVTSTIIFIILYLVMYICVTIFNVNPTVKNRIYENEVVIFETPEVTEKRYELFTENDMGNSNNLDFSSIIKICDEQKSGENYYIIYYKIEDDKEILAVPILVDESDIEIIPKSHGVEAFDSEYLLEITEKYYKEDRNVEPHVVEDSHTEVRYELYLRESTIKKIPELKN